MVTPDKEMNDGFDMLLCFRIISRLLDEICLRVVMYNQIKVFVIQDQLMIQMYVEHIFFFRKMDTTNISSQNPCKLKYSTKELGKMQLNHADFVLTKKIVE